MRHLALVSLVAFLGTAAAFAIPKDSLAINKSQTSLSQQLAQQIPSPPPKPRAPRKPRK